MSSRCLSMPKRHPRHNQVSPSNPRPHTHAIKLPKLPKLPMHLSGSHGAMEITTVPKLPLSQSRMKHKMPCMQATAKQPTSEELRRTVGRQALALFLSDGRAVCVPPCTRPVSLMSLPSGVVTLQCCRLQSQVLQKYKFRLLRLLCFLGSPGWCLVHIIRPPCVLSSWPSSCHHPLRNYVQ